MRVKGLNHVELLLPADKVADAAKTFGDLLGIAFPEPHIMEAQKLISVTCWEAGIEIIAPTSPDSPLQSALERTGSGGGGVGPIAWRVDSVDTMRHVANGMGITVAFELAGKDGSRSIYLSPANCFGYVVSFIERPGIAFPSPPPAGALVSHLNRIELLTTTDHAHAAAAFFGKLFDTEMEIEYMAEHDVLSGTSWEAGIEVFAPGSQKSVLNKSLAKKGERGSIGPIVWEVSDMAKLKERAVACGHSIQYEFKTDERHQVSLGAETLLGYTATFTQRIG